MNEMWGAIMHGSKVILATLSASMLLAASVSVADARGFHHRGPGVVLGLLGGVIVGAATIATLPFAILADAARPAPPPRDYYGQDARRYGPPQDPYGNAPSAPPPPPRYYRNYGPPPGYYGYGY